MAGPFFPLFSISNNKKYNRATNISDRDGVKRKKDDVDVWSTIIYAYS